MFHIDTLDEYICRIDEKRTPLTNRTGNEVSAMLGKSEKTGKEIFNVINKNVETLERLIDDFNKKHEAKIRKSPLEVKIDKTKLDISYLLSLTKLKRTSFISDVIVSNILNYKILIRPIKNAKILALAYRYYLAMVRHTLQNALIAIEMSSDLFFTQINSNLTGRRKQMKETMDMLVQQARNLVAASIESGQFIDERTGKKMSLKGVVGSDAKVKQITQMIKTMNGFNKESGITDRSYGYNQNVFQEFGRSIESQIKSNQDKELQSIAEQFNTVANSTTGFTKDDQASAKEHVSNYAQSVKLSTERRAMEVCGQINMNMIEIIKIFSLRNIDNFSEYFNESDNITSMEDKCNKLIEAKEKEFNEYKKRMDGEFNKALNKTEFTEDEKKEMLEFWRDKGIDTLCTPVEFKSIVEKKDKSVVDILEKNGFNPKQIYSITQGDESVDDYGKIYYEDFRQWCKKANKHEVNNSKYKDNPKMDDEDLLCWMRTDSIQYKKIKGLNRTSGEGGEGSSKKTRRKGGLDRNRDSRMDDSDIDNGDGNKKGRITITKIGRD